MGETTHGLSQHQRPHRKRTYPPICRQFYLVNAAKVGGTAAIKNKNVICTWCTQQGHLEVDCTREARCAVCSGTHPQRLHQAVIEERELMRKQELEKARPQNPVHLATTSSLAPPVQTQSLASTPTSVPSRSSAPSQTTSTSKATAQHPLNPQPNFRRGGRRGRRGHLRGRGNWGGRGRGRGGGDFGAGCYNCGDPSHRAAGCPWKICFWCRKTGHIARWCPERLSGAPKISRAFPHTSDSNSNVNPSANSVQVAEWKILAQKLEEGNKDMNKKLTTLTEKMQPTPSAHCIPSSATKLLVKSSPGYF